MFRVALMVRDIVAQRLGAGEEFAADRLCYIDQLFSRLRELGERCGGKPGGERVDGRSTVAQPRGLAQQQQIVGEAVAPARCLDRRHDHLVTGVGERDQVAREIAAVDGRDVFRLQRAQILGGIPVEEVAAEALQLVQRRERRLQPLDGLERAAPAEIARRDARQQIEPDIRRRRAPRDDGLRTFLEIVGRQEIVLRRHEALEEAPGAPRDQAQAARIRRAECELAVLARRQARQPRDERRERP
jgi:hypothetical protein